MGSPGDQSSSWVASFLNTPYGDFLCHIDDEYIRDRFNLTYLEREVSNFRKAYEMIIGDHFDDEYQDEAIRLYGLIHARYILSPTGLSKMYAKYRQSSFGTCPRVLCDNYPVLPVGISDRPGQSSVRLFCPKCRDVYVPRNKRAQAFDGAWFGTSFPHFLLQTYKENAFLNEEKTQYVPKIFGFKLAN
jgi:casein kinase II subunit beta